MQDSKRYNWLPWTAPTCMHLCDRPSRSSNFRLGNFRDSGAKIQRRYALSDRSSLSALRDGCTAVRSTGLVASAVGVFSGWCVRPGQAHAPAEPARSTSGARRPLQQARRQWIANAPRPWPAHVGLSGLHRGRRTSTTTLLMRSSAPVYRCTLSSDWNRTMAATLAWQHCRCRVKSVASYIHELQVDWGVGGEVDWWRRATLARSAILRMTCTPFILLQLRRHPHATANLRNYAARVPPRQHEQVLPHHNVLDAKVLCGRQSAPQGRTRTVRQRWNNFDGARADRRGALPCAL